MICQSNLSFFTTLSKYMLLKSTSFFVYFQYKASCFFHNRYSRNVICQIGNSAIFIFLFLQISDTISTYKQEKEVFSCIFMNN